MFGIKKDRRTFFEKISGASTIQDAGLRTTTDEDEESDVVAVERDVEDSDSEGQLTVDVYQTPTEIVIKTMVAGVDPDDLDVSINRDMVTIHGKREMEHTVTRDDYFYQELYWGSFSRTILLPQEIDDTAAEAITKHGLLILKLPKLNKNKRTKLKIKSHE
ncbi:MAG: Hsp20/alpha crystallin family protein [Candidatus Paceibacterota bacterium]|jgi:HSP20 family protein